MIRFKLWGLLLIFNVLLAACTGNNHVPEAEPIYNQTPTPVTSKMSEEQLSQLSKKLYQNVTKGDAEQFLTWNDTQQALHLGFGFVWYPQTSANVSKSTFPAYLRYLQSQNVPLPIWLMNAQTLGAPWTTRQSFATSQRDPEIRELRRILETTKELQALYLLQRLHEKTPTLVQAASGADRERLIHNLQSLQNAKGGLYPLLDYMSFDEKGLSIVLSGMQKQDSDQQVLAAFVESIEENAQFNGTFAPDRIQSYLTPIY